MKKIIFITVVILLIGILFFFLIHTKDSWQRGDTRGKKETVKENGYTASFDYWDTEVKSIEIHPTKDNTYTFTYDTQTEKGTMCISLWKKENHRELKEICKNQKGVFQIQLEKEQTYEMNISGRQAKKGNVQVSWDEK